MWRRQPSTHAAVASEKHRQALAGPQGELPNSFATASPRWRRVAHAPERAWGLF